MTKFKSLVLGTVGFWALLTMAHAYLYVSSRIALPNAEGYEREWDWQLFFFTITRFPFLLAILLLVLWWEYRNFKSP